jgi:tetratricopeptide (TPR) repeat protein
VDIQSLLVVLVAALSFAATDAPQKSAAQHELYSAHWSRAAELYREILRADPSQGDAWDALVRALIEAHRADDAYAAADDAMKNAPETAGAYTARGRALYRQGHLAEAEASFLKAFGLNEKYADALAGLARVRRGVAKFKMAEDLDMMAYRAAPDDPELILSWANTLKGAQHVAALRRALAIFDPETREARSLRAHIASDVALGDRHARVLESPYREYELNLVNILSGPRQSRGVGLRVRFNDSYEATLLLDTGAGGLSLSRKAAKKAGFEALEEEGTEVHGVGDRNRPNSFRYLASEVRDGDLILRNYPVAIFDAAKDSDADGLIGGDVFARFLVQLDWPHMKLRLLPYPGVTTPSEDARDSDPPANGFQRIYSVGHLLIPTLINDEPASLFLIDSGASMNLVNATAARNATKVRGDHSTVLRGVQGRVDSVSRADRVRLTFANFRQDNTDMLAMDLSHASDELGIEVAGVLGMPVLSQLVVTIDYRNAAIRLERGRR